MLRVIKSDDDYRSALSQVDGLLDLDPDPGTKEGDRLELLALLVEKYEAEQYTPRLPDPIEAIRFRMDQQHLTQRDLIPFLGSPSRVSEVLSRKRPLTLKMLRALHKGLGIPASVLLQEHNPSWMEETDIDWDRFPLAIMIKWGWIHEPAKDANERAEEIMRGYFSQLGNTRNIAMQCRMTKNIRSTVTMDPYALTAWTARVIAIAKRTDLPAKYVPGIVDEDFLQTLARQSWSENGPLLAKEYLAKHGIHLIVERHLPKTHLDGAAIMLPKQEPIIALTLRYDRIDNFWFCLMHELAHLALHLDDESPVFHDDLEADAQGNRQEAEADKHASDALIPEDRWKASDASKKGLRKPVEALAEKLGIHVAIVAGRVRHELKDHRRLWNLVGRNQVRSLFPEVKWE